ncbi:trehalose phosphatase [Ameyamaea chiangmaiensis NBRC 103196]|uniref:Trehalose 6-phosphate phosphatase n=1 Tax=Ameyamaea chiangmaiensis TaxID=442969 RepID=A0A850PAH4_9PROT|nr:trehalose-phosphatase [Ameyamaea chiangmaiensis]MBS4075863.1 trehalose-phosphatase [Ameyamaea chiangmaiensis]NVN40948.1 trehalose-phosphatase [Ameyamaea chiangmaiensis]GBQ64019.1 trehalose phosphatase [Ameyamaea chiangmaiensis NBRC 103196]
MTDTSEFHAQISQLPPPDRTAFLFDFDGTLVDIAPTPDSVVVPDTLKASLRALRGRVGGALGVISGRAIDQIDHFLDDLPYAVAGEHGIAVRHAPGAAIERADLPVMPAAWLEEADAVAARVPGVLVERKRAGFVLHFRAVPAKGDALRAMAERWVGSAPGFHIQAAKMAWEIRPAGVDKGHALNAVMASAPFAGRLPVFVGDDVTDDDAIAQARALGGVGFRLPEDFADPTAFRGFLARLAASGEGASWGV